MSTFTPQVPIKSHKHGFVTPYVLVILYINFYRYKGRVQVHVFELQRFGSLQTCFSGALSVEPSVSTEHNHESVRTRYILYMIYYDNLWYIYIYMYTVYIIYIYTYSVYILNTYYIVIWYILSIYHIYMCVFFDRDSFQHSLMIWVFGSSPHRHKSRRHDRRWEWSWKRLYRWVKGGSWPLKLRDFIYTYYQRKFRGRNFRVTDF